MPIPPLPKSGCTGSSRPTARTIPSEPGRVVTPSTRWFQGLEAGKTMQPAIAAAASIPLSWHAPMRLLVTGGAGYIGSIVAQQLVGRGDDVTVLDSLYKGHRAAVPEGAAFVEADLLDVDAVARAFDSGFDAVVHFAAMSLVSESVEFPERYWRGNVVGALNLLDAMRAAGVRKLVFSS